MQGKNDDRNGGDELSPNFSLGVSLLPPSLPPTLWEASKLPEKLLLPRLLNIAHDKDGDYHEGGDDAEVSEVHLLYQKVNIGCFLGSHLF